MGKRPLLATAAEAMVMLACEDIWGEAFLKERRVSIWMKSFQGNFERAAATGIT